HLRSGPALRWREAAGSRPPLAVPQPIWRRGCGSSCRPPRAAAPRGRVLLDRRRVHGLQLVDDRDVLAGEPVLATDLEVRPHVLAGPVEDEPAAHAVAGSQVVRGEHGVQILVSHPIHLQTRAGRPLLPLLDPSVIVKPSGSRWPRRASPWTTAPMT